MNATYSQGKRVSTRVFLALPIIFFFLFIIDSKEAEAQGDSRWTQLSGTVDGDQRDLSQEARDRMTSYIKSARAQKERGTIGDVTLANKTARKRSAQFTSVVDFTYSDAYFDTESGTSFSFPEDTHDFCRASFDTFDANEDYELDLSIDGGDSLIVQLTWSETQGGVTDYDIYVFDEEGRTVGDPEGVFPDGQNGIAFQTGEQGLFEEAFVNHDGQSEPLFIVVDRFRGEGASTLNLLVTGGGATSQVLQYTGNDAFTYLNAETDQPIGPLTSGLALDLDAIEGDRPNFAVQFSTDGCAESVDFLLVDAATGQTIVDSQDNTAPYALFGDMDGDFVAGDLPAGSYLLTATPYSRDDLQGAQGSPTLVSFDVIAAPDDSARVINFTLIETDSDLTLDQSGVNNPIQDGDVLDLTTLPTSFTIRVDVQDPNGIIQSVDLVAVIQLFSGSTQTITVSDASPPFSLFGDDNNGDLVEGDFLPPEDGWVVGEYTLSAVPVGGAGADPEIFVGKTIQFSIVGPRIEHYSLIDADNNVAIPLFDPIPEDTTLDLSTLPPNLNIRANTIDFTPPVIDGVTFVLTLDDVTVRSSTENYRPYSVFGDCNIVDTNCTVDVDEGSGIVPNYNAWSPLPGEYQLTGVPFITDGTELNPRVLNFTVIQGVNNQADALSTEPPFTV